MGVKKDIVDALSVVLVLVSLYFFYINSPGIAVYLLIAAFLITFLRSIVYRMLSRLGV